MDGGHPRRPWRAWETRRSLVIGRAGCNGCLRRACARTMGLEEASEHAARLTDRIAPARCSAQRTLSMPVLCSPRGLPMWTLYCIFNQNCSAQGSASFGFLSTSRCPWFARCTMAAARPAASKPAPTAVPLKSGSVVGKSAAAGAPTSDCMSTALLPRPFVRATPCYCCFDGVISLQHSFPVGCRLPRATFGTLARKN